MTTHQKFQNEMVTYLTRKAPVMFFTLSRHGVIAEASQYARDITGRELTGENIRDVIIDFTGTFDLAALTDDPSQEHLFNIGNASGLPQSFYFTFRSVEDHILVFGRLDAEELETMRKAILSLNQELNNLTRELHKKNAQLKHLNEEKNRFLGMAAHDLRKPIGLVITYSEFLIEETEGVLNTEHVGFLSTIRASSDFMRRLVDDFLDVSAIEAGKFELALESVSIPDVLDHSLRLNTLQARKKGIELRVESEEDIPRAIMDAAKIEQVITNLVSNAIEHSAPDSLVLIVLSHDAQSIIFSVRDEGPGIPKEELKLLFQPFGKTSVKKTGGEKSTGLGMLITRKIIEAHSGQIWVDSQVGKGTTLYFKLPIRITER